MKLNKQEMTGGTKITLIISDDGRGIDTDRLGQKAVAAGLHTQAEVDAMSPRRKLASVFAAGLSTVDKVSAVSGRGVGMDVVKTEVGSLGGRIETLSTQGRGTEFRLYIPLTLAVTKALIVRAGPATHRVCWLSE